MGHFKMLKSGRKAFLNIVPLEEKKLRKNSCPLYSMRWTILPYKSPSHPGELLLNIFTGAYYTFKTTVHL